MSVFHPIPDECNFLRKIPIGGSGIMTVKKEMR